MNRPVQTRLPPLLRPGDTIGLCAPCNAADPARFASFIRGIEAEGFRVRESRNLYQRTYGYAASEQERADDLHALFWDDEVKMILFGGGNVGNEFLPLLDYEGIGKHPKWVCSYSNGTTLLGALYSLAGLPVCYGQFPGVFGALSAYDRAQFRAHFVDGNARRLEKGGAWHALHGGVAEGVLIGGYTTRFAMMLGSRYFPCDPEVPHLLFLENHRSCRPPGAVASHLAEIEQSSLMPGVKGLLFGHYDDAPEPELEECLDRFARRHRIPVVCCDDFGHGQRHGILPMGQWARLDGDEGALYYHRQEA